jgi:ribonuclease BN (tRNA processing enzyme)
MAPVWFRSLRSGSSGNCLALWNHNSSVLIDCGVRPQYECRAMLAGHQQLSGRVHAVLVSHAHGDHMSYESLRVLRKERIAIHGHRHVVDQLHDRHGLAQWDQPPALHATPQGPLKIGDFSIRLIEVAHAPNYPNFGFVITTPENKIVIVTDFHESAGLVEHFVDADFIYIESNHDLDLLRQRPNPASRYHLNNHKTASLLCDVVQQGNKAPAAVMLGHLSDERNEPHIALREVRKLFEARRVQVGFDLSVAPRNEPSKIIRIE